MGEVIVKGSTALGCETKMVREWLRVSCHGKSDTAGTPENVFITRGGGSDTYTFASGGITSLVMRFVAGTHLEAVFSWSDKSHKLVVKWPLGAPKPATVAVFEGAQSPPCTSQLDTGCDADLYVQLMTVGSHVPRTYDYPKVQKLVRGDRSFRGVRVVEAFRGSDRIVAAIVRNRCQSERLISAAQEALRTGAGARCERLNVVRSVLTVK